MDELKNETTAPKQETQGTASEPKTPNPMVAMLLNPKIIGGIVGVIVVLWLISALFGGKSTPVDVTTSRGVDMQTSYNKQQPLTTSKKDEPPLVTLYPKSPQTESQPVRQIPPSYTPYSIPKTDAENKAAADTLKKTMSSMMGSGQRIRGIAFLTGCIEPLEYELNRTLGWRPNDIVRPTDNVNNFQLGVLEVTRRSAMHLAQRISRTGSTAVIDPDLEQAMNRLDGQRGKVGTAAS
ncbi:MAG: DUF2333 family protein [Desulfobacteraceae bacterium]|nr:DUF2333 family protein [Desulfobacteraceae bacterium]